jgi:hypothetical protein
MFWKEYYNMLSILFLTVRKLLKMDSHGNFQFGDAGVMLSHDS